MKLSITFQSWLNNQPTPTTWRNIIKVIEEEPIQNKSLATTIQQKLIQGGIFITCFMLLVVFHVIAQLDSFLSTLL